MADDGRVNLITENEMLSLRVDSADGHLRMTRDNGDIVDAGSVMAPETLTARDEAVQAASDAEAAKDAAEAVPTTTDGLVKSLLDDPGSATATDLAATFAPMAELTRVPLNRALVRGYNPPLTVYGDTGLSLRGWRSALEQAADGDRLARIGCYGDSITEGYLSSPAMYSSGYVARLQTIMNSAVGGAGEGFLHWYNPDDFRIVWGGGPVDVANYGPFGNSCKRIACTTINHDQYLQFGPVDCDTFRVYCISQATNKPVHYKIDAGGWTTVSIPAKTSGLANQATFFDIPAGSAGSHTITLSGDMGGTWYLLGLGYHTGTQGVVLSRMGKGGAIPATLVGAVGDGAGSMESAFDAYSPDLSIILFGHNNIPAQTSIVTFTSTMQTIIDRAKQTGDVMLVTTVPRQDGGSYTLKPEDYDRAIYSLADTNHVPVLDLSARWHSDWVWADELGYMGDGVHPDNDGYQQIAQAIANIII